jgi:hypothetical protein
MYSSTPMNPISFSSMATPPLMGRSVAPIDPVMSSPLPLFSGKLVSHIVGFQERNLYWPPEMWDYPCDLHTGSMSEFIGKNYQAINRFITNTTTADINTLLMEVFTDKIWPANRRAFFQALHDQARQQEACGNTISKDLATFYRTRYNPIHVFQIENTAITVPASLQIEVPLSTEPIIPAGDSPV